MPVFSLIIPVCNVQDYLAKCLESCISQTFRDIEIICINDYSPGNSYKILDNYANKDSRIKIITHTQNTGLGVARNTGIEVATGSYCWFIGFVNRYGEWCEMGYKILYGNKALEKKPQESKSFFISIRYLQ